MHPPSRARTPTLRADRPSLPPSRSLGALQIDPELEGTTHVIVDEVHERSLDSDFLLVVLRDLLLRRARLRLVLMSATMSPGLFAAYFQRLRPSAEVPVVHIPGYTFPVTALFLADAVEYLGEAAQSLQVTLGFARSHKTLPRLPPRIFFTKLEVEKVISEQLSGVPLATSAFVDCFVGRCLKGSDV